MNVPTSSENVAEEPNLTPAPSVTMLERGTAIALCAVLVSLAWMVSAAFQPDYLRVFSLEAEIVIMLVLLLTTLLLVSVIALRHTRGS